MQNNVPYNEVDLSKDPEREQDLINLTGSRIVPAFLFEKKKWYGGTKKKHFIGFEMNEDVIRNMIEKDQF
ncbi:hypothetical protein GCM10009865_44370 [Aeromicrobium ponti]|uniref:Glutaredoxin 3 n=1 Tax=Cytobacillus oceanisediminis TaxID=665099 RepID=A0A562JDX1_9BACI|nr:glutaredoxin 3 [Cytobacillus oceanisediminis]